MKFDKQKLIDLITEGEVAREKREREAWEEKVKLNAEHERVWRTSGSKALAKQLRELAAEAASGEKLTHDVIQAKLGYRFGYNQCERGADLSYEEPPHRNLPSQLPDFVPNKDLQALIKMLNNITDDFISSSALKELGFQPKAFMSAVMQ